MLEQIGHALPHFEVYGKIFHDHQNLQHALSDVYLDLIHFLSGAKRLFSRSSLRLVLWAFWKSFNQTFDDGLASLKRHSRQVEKEAKVAHMIEEAENRLRITEIKTLVESKRDSNLPQQPTLTTPDIAATKRWLNVRECYEEKDGIEYVPNTCEWILSQPEMLRWIEDDDTPLFWLYGAPGCGKTFLYAKILDHLGVKTNMQCAYFFFCGADGERVTTSGLLRSWTFQLAKLFLDAKRLTQNAHLTSENQDATTTEVKMLFISILQVLPVCYLAVDALDECIDRQELYKLLQLIPKRFKLLITSRPLVELANFLHQQAFNQHEKLEILPEMTRLDIERYITSTLQDPALQYDASIVAYIKEKLNRSDGIFMWVHLMLRHIQDQTTNEEIILCLEDLPQGLSKRYDCIINSINQLPRARRLLAHKLFFWITVARRPLKIKEVCAILAVKPAATWISGFVRERRINNAQTTILDVCGHLITARGTQNILKPVHFTVTEYLRDYMANEARYQEIAKYYEAEQLRSHDSLAAAVCLRYLSMQFFSAFQETLPACHTEALTISESDNPDLDLLHYAATQWFQHLSRTGQPEQLLIDIADDFFDETRPNLELLWRLVWFSGSQSHESAECPSNFSATHIAAYFDLHGILQHLLIKRDPSVFDSSGRSPLWWSAARGSGSVTKLLVEAGVNPNVADKYGIAPIHRAAANGDLVVFEHLLSYKTRSHQPVVDAEGWTPLHWASSKGHLAIAKRIMKHSNQRVEYGTPLSLTSSGRTALHFAASNGILPLVDELSMFEKDGRVLDIQDSNGDTALHFAAMNGRLDTVKCLLIKGASAVIRDVFGKSAFDKAVETGNMAVAAALLMHASRTEDCCVEVSTNGLVIDGLQVE